MRLTKAAAVVLWAMVLLPDAGLACRSGHSPKALQLEDVPTEAQEVVVIARVVIEDLYPAVARMPFDCQSGSARA
ncbi:hypothetical protein U8607_23495 [Methylobacterium durans]|uniref:hypothetical protein n=1 Tax=Methylobacterium durans TaxID=2202825 RepID=UPI002AFE97B1|nr:hypothetical protein [Methylobacterium durans]MEA1834294.1 hypothetical protein [Methylobacterium durans]MEA1835059.1 hypothetical protein [Methylobacterium durans]